MIALDSVSDLCKSKKSKKIYSDTQKALQSDTAQLALQEPTNFVCEVKETGTETLYV